MAAEAIRRIAELLLWIRLISFPSLRPQTDIRVFGDNVMAFREIVEKIAQFRLSTFCHNVLASISRTR